MPVVKFRQLVADVYLPRGESTFEALHTIRREMGRNVAMSCLRAAYYGTAVSVPTAKKFLLWAQEIHPKVTLDYDALISAPRASRRSWRTWIKAAPSEPGEYRVRGRLADPSVKPLAGPVFAVVTGQLVGGLVAELHYGFKGYRIVLDERGSGDELEWSGPIPTPVDP